MPAPPPQFRPGRAGGSVRGLGRQETDVLPAVEPFVKRGLAIGTLLLAACAAVPSPSALQGDWGGRHVGLRLTADGGTLEYDCAAGTMTPPLVHADGSFTAEGTHTPGWGGPEIEGQVRPTFAVRYAGSVRGDTLTFQGDTVNGVVLGPFTLRRGAEPIIFRCL